MTTIFLFSAAINFPMLLALGIITRIIIHIRRAKRRGAGGLQHYRTVFGLLFVPILEWLFRWAANALIIYALLGLLFGEP